MTNRLNPTADDEFTLIENPLDAKKDANKDVKKEDGLPGEIWVILCYKDMKRRVLLKTADRMVLSFGKTTQCPFSCRGAFERSLMNAIDAHFGHMPSSPDFEWLIDYQVNDAEDSGSIEIIGEESLRLALKQFREKNKTPTFYCHEVTVDHISYDPVSMWNGGETTFSNRPRAAFLINQGIICYDDELLELTAIPTLWMMACHHLHKSVNTNDKIKWYQHRLNTTEYHFDKTAIDTEETYNMMDSTASAADVASGRWVAYQKPGGGHPFFCLTTTEPANETSQKKGHKLLRWFLNEFKVSHTDVEPIHTIDEKCSHCDYTRSALQYISTHKHDDVNVIEAVPTTAVAVRPLNELAEAFNLDALSADVSAGLSAMSVGLRKTFPAYDPVAIMVIFATFVLLFLSRLFPHTP